MKTTKRYHFTPTRTAVIKKKNKQKTQKIGVRIVVQWVKDLVSSLEAQVAAGCRSDSRLGAVGEAGCSCCLDLTPGSGTSVYCEYRQEIPLNQPTNQQKTHPKQKITTWQGCGKRGTQWNSFEAQWVKDPAFSLPRHGLLLWSGFSPWPTKFSMLWVWPK